MSTIRKRKRIRQPKNPSIFPRSMMQFRAQSEKRKQTQTRVAHAITAMRSEGLSLAKAARIYHIDPRTIVRHAGSGLRKGPDRRYVPRASDRLMRAMVIPTERGLAEIAIRDSRDATKLAKYWDAVQVFLETGDDSALRPFHGQTVTDDSGNPVLLLTNTNELERLGSAGVLSFESIYAKAS